MKQVYRLLFIKKAHIVDNTNNTHKYKTTELYSQTRRRQTVESVSSGRSARVCVCVFVPFYKKKTNYPTQSHKLICIQICWDLFFFLLLTYHTFRITTKGRGCGILVRECVWIYLFIHPHVQLVLWWGWAVYIQTSDDIVMISNWTQKKTKQYTCIYISELFMIVWAERVSAHLCVIL